MTKERAPCQGGNLWNYFADMFGFWGAKNKHLLTVLKINFQLHSSILHFQLLRGDNHPDIRHGCVGLLGGRERGVADGIEDWPGAFGQPLHDKPAGNCIVLQKFQLKSTFHPYCFVLTRSFLRSATPTIINDIIPVFANYEILLVPN